MPVAPATNAVLISSSATCADSLLSLKKNSLTMALAFSFNTHIVQNAQSEQIGQMNNMSIVAFFLLHTIRRLPQLQSWYTQQGSLCRLTTPVTDHLPRDRSCTINLFPISYHCPLLPERSQLLLDIARPCLIIAVLSLSPHPAALSLVLALTYVTSNSNI